MIGGNEFSTNSSDGEITQLRLSPITTGSRNPMSIDDMQSRIESFLKFDLLNKTIQIPPNLSIVATMNTSDSSIYYMDTAFKRRWAWEFIDVNSEIVKAEGVAFNDRKAWNLFIKKLNDFIKSNHKSIRGIEDKQVGNYFIQEDEISNADIQSKLMFFVWDSVFSRDKKPLKELLNLNDDNLITFGDFSFHVDNFIKAINNRNV